MEIQELSDEELGAHARPTSSEKRVLDVGCSAGVALLVLGVVGAAAIGARTGRVELALLAACAGLVVGVAVSSAVNSIAGRRARPYSTELFRRFGPLLMEEQVEQARAALERSELVLILDVTACPAASRTRVRVDLGAPTRVDVRERSAYLLARASAELRGEDVLRLRELARLATEAPPTSSVLIDGAPSELAIVDASGARVFEFNLVGLSDGEHPTSKLVAELFALATKLVPMKRVIGWSDADGKDRVVEL